MWVLSDPPLCVVENMSQANIHVAEHSKFVLIWFEILKEVHFITIANNNWIHISKCEI